MSLPSFLSRVHDAAGPLLGGIDESELGRRLETTTVEIEIGDAAAGDAGQRAGFLTAVDLLTRLYPRLIFSAPSELAEQARKLAKSINPDCQFDESKGRKLTLSWNGGEASADRVTVYAKGWDLAIDGEAAAEESAIPVAAMAAAALGVGELFRSLFSDLLIHGRETPAPFTLNLLTMEAEGDSPPLPEKIEVGEVHLAGCGAIGHATVAAFKQMPIAGTLVAVDHDNLDQGNLQRYLFSRAADVGKAKSRLIVKALANRPLQVIPVEGRWGEDQHSAPGVRTVLSALDSKQGRIELQAGLPFEIFNAWTQERDIGVSRHQGFGSDPCLACISWPKKPRPSETQLIAEALQENELRVVIYRGNGVPVGAPLPAQIIAPTGRLPLPADAGQWAERSLLQDLIERLELPKEKFESFAGQPIETLYRDAVCGGLLLEHASVDRDTELAVPLAHQSALAGILLATWLVVDRVEELRELRPDASQARYDQLQGGEQIWPRYWGRYERCLCHDPDFQAAYQTRWPEAAGIAS